jgi:hypothetical protein
MQQSGASGARQIRIPHDAAIALDKIVAHYQKPLPKGIKLTVSDVAATVIFREAKRLGVIA